VTAREIARVLRPGGRIGLCSWTPEGGVGRLFAATSRFAPPPPNFASPPLLWGAEDHLLRLFAGTGVEPRFERGAVDFRFDSVEAMVDEYIEKFGPVARAHAAMEAEGRGSEVRESLVSFGKATNRATDGTVAFPGEYLVVLGEKRA
jgi:hypothetical protein